MTIINSIIIILTPCFFTLVISCNAPKNFMMYSLSNTIFRFHPDTSNYSDIVHQIRGLQHIQSIEFDAINQYIYWIDVQTMSIKKTVENKTDSDIIVSEKSGYPIDLALDPLGRLLFWSCAINDAINVIKLNNDSALGIVVKGDGEKPKHIAIHSEKRLLFWTDIGRKMRLMRSNMDGKERVVIATDLENPTSIAVDEASNIIYWAHGNRIECADFDGHNRRILVYPVLQGSTANLAVLYDFVYWFDRETLNLERVNKFGYERKVIMNKILTDLITVNTPQDDTMNTHFCSPFQDYGGCSHFCIGIISSKCSCPMSWRLSEDNKTCRAAPTHDGREGCAHNSDELTAFRSEKNPKQEKKLSEIGKIISVVCVTLIGLIVITVTFCAVYYRIKNKKLPDVAGDPPPPKPETLAGPMIPRVNYSRDALNNSSVGSIFERCNISDYSDESAGNNSPRRSHENESFTTIETAKSGERSPRSSISSKFSVYFSPRY